MGYEGLVQLVDQRHIAHVYALLNEALNDFILVTLRRCFGLSLLSDHRATSTAQN